MPPQRADSARASRWGEPRSAGIPTVTSSSPLRERIATPFSTGLSVAGDRVAAGGELACEQLVERRVGELGLLQADDVGLTFVEPRQQARERLLGRVDVPGRAPHRAYASDSLRRGSGYEQAKAKLRCIESDEVAVAFGPPA